MANFAVSSFLLSAALCSAAPLKGSDMAPRSDGVAVINEPCYVHDAACEGYPVCCVIAGTCISRHSGTISSNTAYYEGGCQSLSSRRKEWSNSSGCSQQGECLIQHLEVCMGATTKAGYIAALPAATEQRLMTDSCEASCPNENYGHRTMPGTGTTTTGTTTTTTPVRMTMQGEFTIISSAAMGMTEEKKAELFGMLIAHMAGTDVSASMVQHSIETSGTSHAVSFTITMIGQDATQMSQTRTMVNNTLRGLATTQIDHIASMIFGTCSYTLSAGGNVRVDTPENRSPTTTTSTTTTSTTGHHEVSKAPAPMVLMMSMVALVLIISNGI